MRPIGHVSHARALAPGPEHPQKGPSHAVENEKLGFRPVAENAPHPWRQPGDHLLAAELAAPAVEDPPPHLHAEPPGRPVAHIRHVTETAQEPHVTENDGRRAREVEERQEGNQSDEAHHHGCQRLPGSAPDQECKGNDTETDEHPDEGPATSRKDHDEHLARQQSGQEPGAEDTVDSSADGNLTKRPRRRADDPPGDQPPPARGPVRTEADQPHRTGHPHDAGQTAEPLGTGRRRPAPGLAPLVQGPLQACRGQRDEHDQVAAEEDVLPEGRAHRQRSHRGIPRLRQRIPPSGLTEREQADGDAPEQCDIDDGADGAGRPALGLNQEEHQRRRGHRQQPHAAAKASQQALERGDRGGGGDGPPRHAGEDDPAKDARPLVGGGNPAAEPISRVDQPREAGRRRENQERPHLRIVIRPRRLTQDRQGDPQRHRVEAGQDERGGPARSPLGHRCCRRPTPRCVPPANGAWGRPRAARRQEAPSPRRTTGIVRRRILRSRASVHSSM